MAPRKTGLDATTYEVISVAGARGSATVTVQFAPVSDKEAPNGEGIITMVLPKADAGRFSIGQEYSISITA